MEDTLKKLQKSIGDVVPELKIHKSKFKNWAGTQEAEVILATPTKVEDVQKIVEAAGKQNLRVCITACIYIESAMIVLCIL